MPFPAIFAGAAALGSRVLPAFASRVAPLIGKQAQGHAQDAVQRGIGSGLARMAPRGEGPLAMMNNASGASVGGMVGKIIGHIPIIGGVDKKIASVIAPVVGTAAGIAGSVLPGPAGVLASGIGSAVESLAGQHAADKADGPPEGWG